MFVNVHGPLCRLCVCICMSVCLHMGVCVLMGLYACNHKHDVDVSYILRESVSIFMTPFKKNYFRGI